MNSAIKPMNVFQDHSSALPSQRASRPLSRTTGRHQSGVGLIEVLVAVLVLSIAFLGIAALQAMSLSTNNSAMARSMATIASYSILDAMRTDMVSAKSGSYNTTVVGNACPAAATGGTLEAAQTSQWCGQLASTLGTASTTTGQIECNPSGTTGVDCTITITFDDSRAGVGGTNGQKVVTRAML
jgi:type IV pilus assembly protein PilV